MAENPDNTNWRARRDSDRSKIDDTLAQTKVQIGILVVIVIVVGTALVTTFVK